MAKRGGQRWMRSVFSALWLMTLVLATAAPAQAQQVEYPLNSNGVMSVTLNGEFVVAEDDLRVKVPGGFVRINRDFDGVQWTINRQWSGLHSPGAARAFYASVGTYISCTIYDGINSCDSGSGSAVRVPGNFGDLLKNRGSMRILNDEDFVAGQTPDELPEFITRKGTGFSISSDRASYGSNDYPRFVIRPQAVLKMADSAGPDAHPAQGDPRISAETEAGFRWSDRSGQWIEYDNKGRITSYGDRNDVRVWFQYGNHGQVERVLDDNGRTVFTLLYTDADAEFVAEIRDHTPLGGGIRRVRYEYDDDQLVRVFDARGHVTRFEYSGAKLSKVVDATGRATTIHYNAPPVPRSSYRVASGAGAGGGTATRSAVSGDGLRAAQQRRLSKIVAPDGGETEITYDYDRLKKEFAMTVRHPETDGGRRVEHVRVDSDGRLVSYEINGNVLLSSTGSRKNATYTDERGGQTTIRRDAFDEIISVTNADGSSVRYTFEAGSMDLREVVDEAGIVDRYEYDERGNLLKSTWAAGKPEQQVRQYHYDERGQLKEVVLKGVSLPGGGATGDVHEFFEYDAHGNVVAHIDGEGHRWEADYDAQGNQIRLIDPLGNSWEASYDAHGNLIKDIDPTANTWRYEYDAAGRHSKVIDGAGNEWTTTFDAAGREYSQVDPLGNTFVQERDPAGQLRLTRDASGHQTTIDYDAAGRVAGVTDVAGARTDLFYTDVDGIDRGTRQAARVEYPTFERRLRYDSRRRQTQQADISDEDARVTGTTHDVLNRLQSVTDANGHTHTYAYDGLGRLVVATDPLGSSVTLAYDQRDNVVLFTDENGRLTRFTYDGRGLLSEEINPVGERIRYEYDLAGNLEQIVKADGARIVYERDRAARVIARKGYRPDGELELSHSFNWSDAGVLSGWSVNGASASLEHDAADRLLRETVVIGDASLARTYTYHPNGTVATVTGPDGVTLQYSYDGYDNLDRVDIPGEGSISITSREWMAPATVVYPGGVIQEQERDGLLNLTRLRVRSPQQITLFELTNHFGQLTELSARAVDGQETQFEYDEALQLVKAHAAFVGGVSETFAIDAAGNRTSHSAATGLWEYDDANRLQSKDGVSYTYDPSGNMVRKVDVRKTEPQRTTHYRYDVLNRLVEVRDGHDAIIASYRYDPFDNRLSKTVGGVTTIYLHGDEGLLAEADGAGRVLRSYGWDLANPYASAPLFQRVEGAYYYYHNDHQGTPWRVTNRDGAVVWSAARYTAYGSATIAPGAQIEQPWRFPGQYLDIETGLHYNLRRYYDAETGRYLSEDPLRFGASSNLYSYAENSPQNFIDPTGEVAFLAPAAWGALRWVAGRYGTCLLECAAVSSVVSLVNNPCDVNVSHCLTDCLWSLIPIKLPCNAWGMAGSAVGAAAGAFNSFPGETLVLTPDGRRRIDSLKPGDEVIAYVEWEDLSRTERITDVMVSQREQLIVTITLESGREIAATGGHPIHTPSGWRAAQLLEAGGQLDIKDPDGRLVPARIAHVTHRTEVTPVYNLEVAHAHTFFVGDDGVLVHNARKGRGGKQPRLRELHRDPKTPSHIRGWIQQELNAIGCKKRKNIRVPPGYELAHRRGKEARHGFDYRHSDPQNIDLHRSQHRIERRR